MRYGIFGQFLFQFIICYESLQDLTCVVIQGNQHRSIEAGKLVHEIFHRAAEDGTVGSRLIAQFHLLALTVYLVYRLTHRAFFIAGVIKLVGIRIPSDKVFYFIVTAGHLFDQVTVHAIPVQVRISAFIANKAEIFGIELNVIEYIFVDVIRRFVA